MWLSFRDRAGFDPMSFCSTVERAIHFSKQEKKIFCITLVSIFRMLAKSQIFNIQKSFFLFLYLFIWYACFATFGISSLPNYPAFPFIFVAYKKESCFAFNSYLIKLNSKLSVLHKILLPLVRKYNLNLSLHS